MSEVKETKKIATSALMAALAALLNMLTVVPVIQLLGILLCPVPLTWVGYQYGIKYLLISTAVSTLLVFLFMGPVQAYIFFSLFGIVAIVTGYAVYKKYSPARTIMVGTLLLMFFNIFFYYGVEKTLGLEDTLADFSKSSDAFVQKFADYTMARTPPIQREAFIMWWKSCVRKLLLFPLTLFTFASFAGIYINYFASSLVFMKLGAPLPLIEPVFFWRAPWWLVIPFLLVLSAGSNRFFNHTEFSDAVYFNLNMIFLFTYFFLGFGVANFFFFRFNLPWYMRLFALPFLFRYAWITAFIGLTDCFLNYRDLPSAPAAQKKKLYRKKR
ncbi:MAG: DUF2232 domain-containing protein [Candidatus Wallbacteria bacterium]|nr:DUF2232 domain-containing protein [Candidatus Wallbacteria bacterium]